MNSDRQNSGNLSAVWPSCGLCKAGRARVCVRNGVRLGGGSAGGLVVPRVPRRAGGRAGPGPAIPGRRGLRRRPPQGGGGTCVGRAVRSAAGGLGTAARGRGGAGLGASRGTG